MGLEGQVGKQKGCVRLTTRVCRVHKSKESAGKSWGFLPTRSAVTQGEKPCSKNHIKREETRGVMIYCYQGYFLPANIPGWLDQGSETSPEVDSPSLTASTSWGLLMA